MIRIIIRAIWHELRHGQTPTWMFLVVSVAFWLLLIPRAIDYFKWDRPMAHCAERAQHAPDLRETCDIHGARVTIISNGLQR